MRRFANIDLERRASEEIGCDDNPASCGHLFEKHFVARVGPAVTNVAAAVRDGERQGVVPEDADLEAVRGFLDAILPALAELERSIPETIAAPQ